MARDDTANFRPATVDDTRAIATIHVETGQAVYRGLLPDSFLGSLCIDERQRKWAEILAAEDLKSFVAESGAKVAGFVTVGPTRDLDCQEAKTGDLIGIYLADEARR